MKDGGYIIKIHRKNATVVSMQIKFRKKFHCIYANKIHVKDTIAVPIYWKFNIQIPESLYRSKIASSDTAFSKKTVSEEAIFTI